MSRPQSDLRQAIVRVWERTRRKEAIPIVHRIFPACPRDRAEILAGVWGWRLVCRTIGHQLLGPKRYARREVIVLRCPNGRGVSMAQARALRLDGMWTCTCRKWTGSQQSREREKDAGHRPVMALPPYITREREACWTRGGRTVLS